MTFPLCQYSAPWFRGHVALPQLTLSYNCCRSLTVLQLEGLAHLGVFIIQPPYRIQNYNLRGRKCTGRKGLRYTESPPPPLPLFFFFICTCPCSYPVSHLLHCARPAGFLPWWQRGVLMRTACCFVSFFLLFCGFPIF